MNLWLAAAGLGLVGVVLFDALQTTMSMEGSGFATGRISRATWLFALHLHRRRRRHRLLAGVGPVILVAIIGFWILGLWIGYTLVFSADPGAVVDSQTGAPADTWERAYYAGYTLFTLGLGDFVPGSSLWRISTVIVSLSGLALVTMAITYLIPVLSAVVEKRRLAAVLHDLGPGPGEILGAAAVEDGFSGIDSRLERLATELDLHTQRHYAYPVLHYFHSNSRRTAIAPGIAALDEALTVILECGRDVSPAVERVRKALTGYLGTVRYRFVRGSTGAPPTQLDDFGPPALELRDSDCLPRAARENADRRAQLLALVRDDGWEWKDVSRSDVNA